MQYDKIILPATIGRVIDGDTIYVSELDHLLHIYSKNIRIRLAWIDAPSLRTSLWKEAKSVLEAKISWQDVWLSFTKIKSKTGETESRKDKYGRFLGTIRIGDRNINQEMIDEWYAVIRNK